MQQKETQTIFIMILQPTTQTLSLQEDIRSPYITCSTNVQSFSLFLVVNKVDKITTGLLQFSNKSINASTN